MTNHQIHDLKNASKFVIFKLWYYNKKSYHAYGSRIHFCSPPFKGGDHYPPFENMTSVNFFKIKLIAQFSIKKCDTCPIVKREVMVTPLKGWAKMHSLFQIYQRRGGSGSKKLKANGGGLNDSAKQQQHRFSYRHVAPRHAAQNPPRPQQAQVHSVRQRRSLPVTIFNSFLFLSIIVSRFVFS